MHLKKKIFLLCFLLLQLQNQVYSVAKQHYGGNAKISEDLSAGLLRIRLFESRQEDLAALYPVNFTREENTLRVDLSQWPADRITEMERSIALLQDESNPCHWILDYPYFHHSHSNSVKVEKDQLILQAGNPEDLEVLAQSTCLLPQKILYLLPFSKTQFGYEANQNCIAGRPFLDSISPVVIDPVNPYLAFKLNEVDVFVIPEEKFRQISSDDQIMTIPGPHFFVYLKSENLTPQQMTDLMAVIDIQEISRAVLNDHATPLLPEKGGFTTWKTPIYLKLPDEALFRLVGERLKIQWENAGFVITTKALPKNSAFLDLSFKAVQEGEQHLFRYRLLREDLRMMGEIPWSEAWGKLEASGKVIPLLLYESRVAVRKNLVEVRPGAGGFPDFSNAWILPAP